MHQLIVLLLSLSISFESLAVLTKLFVMKAKHNYCPILLVSNVDAIEPTRQGLDVTNPLVNEHQIAKLKQVWTAEIAKATKRTPLITSGARPMLLLYRNQLKFLDEAMIPHGFSRLLAEVPFNQRHVAFIDCADNEIFSRADLSFKQLLESPVTLQDVYDAYDSMRERLYRSYFDANWLAAYWSSPSKPEMEGGFRETAQRYLFSCFLKADASIAEFKEKTRGEDPRERTIFSLAKFPTKDEHYDAFKLAFLYLNTLDMYFRVTSLSSAISASADSSRVHRIVIIADPSHINLLTTVFEETNHELILTYPTEGTQLADSDLEMLVFVSSIFQSLVVDKLRPSPDYTVRYTSDEIAEYIRRSRLMRVGNEEQCCPCVLI